MNAYTVDAWKATYSTPLSILQADNLCIDPLLEPIDEKAAHGQRRVARWVEGVPATQASQAVAVRAGSQAGSLARGRKQACGHCGELGHKNHCRSCRNQPMGVPEGEQWMQVPQESSDEEDADADEDAEGESDDEEDGMFI